MHCEIRQHGGYPILSIHARTFTYIVFLVVWQHLLDHISKQVDVASCVLHNGVSKVRVILTDVIKVKGQADLLSVCQANLETAKQHVSLGIPTITYFQGFFLEFLYF